MHHFDIAIIGVVRPAAGPPRERVRRSRCNDLILGEEAHLPYDRPPFKGGSDGPGSFASARSGTVPLMVPALCLRWRKGSRPLISNLVRFARQNASFDLSGQSSQLVRACDAYRCPRVRKVRSTICGPRVTLIDYAINCSRTVRSDSSAPDLLDSKSPRQHVRRELKSLSSRPQVAFYRECFLAR